MKQIGWGFIGCGEVTEKKSGPAFNEVPGSSVVAVMSRNEAKAKSYAKRHNIKRWYTDPQELIDDPNVNSVYIATPPSSHATFAIMAMKAGKPVYIENRWQQATRTVPASTASARLRACRASWLTTDATCPISRR